MIRVEQERQVDSIRPSAGHILYESYARALRPLARLAVQRHVMRPDEFWQTMQDSQIRKFLAYDERSRFVGMSVITNDLRAWPLISPEFFAHRYPEEFDRQDIWYIGFAFATGDRLGVLPALLRSMYPLSRNGISVMDFCSVNVEKNLPGYTRGILKQIDGRVGMHQIDAQEFWAIDFQEAS